MSEIKKIGSFSFVDTAAGQYAINMDWSQSMSQFFNAGSQDWDGDPVSVAGVRVVPWGPDNNMPNAIRDLLEKNNLGPGILDRKVGLLYGQGPMLYRVKIENANNLPEIIKHLNENMIAAAYVVHSPQEYWNQKHELIMAMHEDWDETKIQKEMERLKDELTETIANVMAGKKNAGKFFSCVDFVDADGNAQSWKIEPIEMNIDKYIEAQAKISRIADSSTTSGFGLSPALANIIIDGKSDSGSQMLYALKIFYGADTQIPEDIVLEAINDAIRINFPHKKGIFLGIYRKVINKEENVSTPDRAAKQV